MNTSPLEFAKKFGKLKSDINSQLSDDNRLLLIQTFWKEHLSLLNDKSYQSYFDEFKELFSLYIKEDSITDLTIDELKNLLELSQSINLSDTSKIIVTRLVKLLCYVGELKNALTACQDLTGKDIDPSEIPEDLFGQSGIEPLREICHHLKRLNSKSYEIFNTVLSEWEQISTSLHNNQAVALFVEKDSDGSALRGRMRILKGTVDLRKSIRNDELTFDTQLKAPNDPFVGVVYNSFKAVRNVFKSAGYKKQSSNYYHAHYVIENSYHTFTGDSIGLAAGLVAYTQLLKPEVVRHERFLSGEVAFTGGVDENGKLTPVNNDTLSSKIERAFFSPVKYLVLPESNAVATREHLDKLNKQYPHRRLHLVPAEYLSDVIENLNIVRAEKVCPGKVAIKIVTKYSRMTKVQVPLLLALLYLFICIMYPKAWIGFDRNPQFVKVTKKGFEALNADSITLWSVEYECESLLVGTGYNIGDLNGDGKNEVAFIPISNSFCENGSKLYVYDYQGNLLFKRQCIIDNQYPGDTSFQQLFSTSEVDYVNLIDRTIIITKVSKSIPARRHIKFWNANGDSLSWYINAGYISELVGIFSKGLLFLDYNNRKSSACLYVLSPDSSYGVSPPYIDSIYNLRNVIHGNQLCYILFPRTDLGEASRSTYNFPTAFSFEPDGSLIVRIKETIKPESELWYYFDIDLRVKKVIADDQFIKLRDGLADAGKLPDINWDNYLNDRRDAVTYWTDSGWVTEGELRASEK